MCSLFATRFPSVVSQYSIHVQLTLGPSQNRTCAVNASGSPPAPARHEGTLRVAEGITRYPALCPEMSRVDLRAGLDAFPAPALPGFDPLDWASSFNGTMQPSDSLLSFASLAFSGLSGILAAHDWSS